MGPDSFSLAFRSTVQQVVDDASKRQGKVYAYLDGDVFCIVSDEDDRSFLEVSADAIADSPACLPLNRSKCDEVPVSDVAIRGLSILGTMLGVRRGFFDANVDTVLQGVPKPAPNCPSNTSSCFYVCARLLRRLTCSGVWISTS